MLQRSGDALYSSCAGDNPRTCSANICVVISKCTSRCSRSALVIGSANTGAVNKPMVSVTPSRSKPRSVFLRTVFTLMHMVATSFSNIRRPGPLKESEVLSSPDDDDGRTFDCGLAHRNG